MHTGGRIGFLLIHGLGGTPVELRFVAQGLARAGHTVSCCQLAGHCGTVEDLRTSTWEQWYASVEQAHDRLKKQCDVIIAGGLSMGGILALHLAHRRPSDVHGLTLYAPTLKLDGWSMPWHSILLRLIRPTNILFEFNLPEHDPYGIKDERLRGFVVGSMLSGDSAEAGVFSTPLRSFAHFNSLVSVVKKELGEIKTPALIMHPRDDDIASIGNAFYLQRKLGGLVDVVVMDDSYHIITLDRQRHLVVERSLMFASALEKEAIRRATAARPLHRIAAE